MSKAFDPLTDEQLRKTVDQMSRERGMSDAVMMYSVLVDIAISLRTIQANLNGIEEVLGQKE